MSKTTADEFLAHHGIKGMKWGRRKDEVLLNRLTGVKLVAKGGTRVERKAATAVEEAKYKAYKASMSRSERKKDHEEAIRSKAEYLFEKASKNPNLLVQTRTADGYNTIVTGKEFTKHLLEGGAVNIPLTTIFAEPPKK